MKLLNQSELDFLARWNLKLHEVIIAAIFWCAGCIWIGTHASEIVEEIIDLTINL